MAIKPCRECGQQVSTEAAACPHCGVPSPTGAPPRPEPQPQPQVIVEGTSVGRVATGVFSGILGCFVAPFVVGFALLILLVAVGTCGG